MSRFRIESDSFGPIKVPAQRLWAGQTQRSLQFFAISNERMPAEIIAALVLLKSAAAKVNLALGLLSEAKAHAIIAAAQELLAGQHAQEFPLSLWQTGSGTQSNMNVNEVLANRASEILGGERGEKRLVHPNDGMITTISLPAFSGRLATCSADQTAAPDEMPTSRPSSLAMRRAMSNASSFLTRTTSS